MSKKLETIIGLEIHVQLKTKTKMFCGCSNDGENLPPNTTVCEVCLGHPGVLPVPNRQAIKWSIKAASALNCKINSQQNFDRKNYFYPDLPKGYQISQFDKPIGENGFLQIKNEKYGITRLHLEEDAAKNTHAGDKIKVDYNRGGTPLMEIVTEPDFRSPKATRKFLQELKLIMRYLDVSDADMEKGHLRCDANVSLRPVDEKKLHAKTEIKNLNSFKAVERALEYEVKRQTKLWQETKQPTKQSTRGWDEKSQTTKEQRTKETSQDYRYFPEPDIPPIEIGGNPKSVSLAGKGEKIQNSKQIQNSNDPNLKKTNIIDLDKIKAELPELPSAKKQRFTEEYEVSPANAQVLVENKDLADYFEQTTSELKAWLEAKQEGSADEIWSQHKKKLTKLVSNWLINKLGALVLEQNKSWDDVNITPENMAEFIVLIHENKISSAAAQKVLARMLATGEDPSHIMTEESLEQVSDSGELDSIVDSILKANPDEVARYKAGKTTLLQFFVGKVMRETKGSANPQIAEQLLKEKLSN
jgi:aspartyl-tRNA(Asn)/glutamyl-tRNA(Gln) amidotransferase subunit B